MVTNVGHRARWIWVLIPALVFIGVLAAATARRSGPPRAGDAAPNFAAPLLDGSGTLALEDLRGRPVLLNFWASWCVPCAEEAPILQAAHERYAGLVNFVGVDIRDKRSEALAFVERHQLDYPSVRDEDLGIYTNYGLTGQPETFLIDADGTIVEHIPGPLFEDDLDRLLQSLVSDR